MSASQTSPGAQAVDEAFAALSRSMEIMRLARGFADGQATQYLDVITLVSEFARLRLLSRLVSAHVLKL